MIQFGAIGWAGYGCDVAFDGTCDQLGGVDAGGCGEFDQPTVGPGEGESGFWGIPVPFHVRRRRVSWIAVMLQFSITQVLGQLVFAYEVMGSVTSANRSLSRWFRGVRSGVDGSF